MPILYINVNLLSFKLNYNDDGSGSFFMYGIGLDSTGLDWTGLLVTSSNNASNSLHIIARY